MPPRIQPVGESEHVCWLNFSDPGAGKTSLIGTLGKEYKTLIMRPPIDHADPIIGSGVQEMIVKDWEEIFDGLEYMRHDGHEWDWFWIDSISLLQDIGLDDVYANAIDAKGGRQGARAKYGPDRGEYRVNMWRLEQFIRYIVGTGGFNLGITAHAFWFQDPEEGNSQLMPWIQGKAMPQKISGMMNMVSYMEVRKREIRGETRESRVLHFNKTERFYAKCQFKIDGKPAFEDGGVVNPTAPEILEAIGREKTKKTAPARRGRRPAPTATRPKPAGRTGRSTGRTK